MSNPNPYDAQCKKALVVGDTTYQYYSLSALNDERVKTLPISIRILLEAALRNCDEFTIKKSDIETILNWKESAGKSEIPFKPARDSVLLQDFTGVPAVVDLAAMRDCVRDLKGDPTKINPLVPVDLVIDHSVQVDFAGTSSALSKNEELEFSRNRERFQFLKWGSTAFDNFRIVPPGSGIVHQVNLEYLARQVMHDSKTELLYPDSVVGTDSHTVMIDGLGVLGWGVGGIEAEATMLGQAISMVLPQVIGYKLTNQLPSTSTATDLVLTVVANLRARGVVGKFVEFFGDGLRGLSLADRAVLSNMGPEYGATIGFFAADENTMEYLKQTNRSEKELARIRAYLEAQSMFVEGDNQSNVVYTDVMELDLSTVVASVAGPKRPHDRVQVDNLKKDFASSLSNPVGFKGFGLPAERQKALETECVGRDGRFALRDGSVCIAAITSCTNTSNPSVVLSAALLAKAAVERGLTVPSFCKTSLAPGSHVVEKYLESSKLLPYLDQLGFNIVGFGCTTCIGNSGPLSPPVTQEIIDKDLVVAGVLSGNRNFEGRIHPYVRANYLASPPLVVAYALAGNVFIDFETEPLGKDKDGKDVFLRDLWPSSATVSEYISKYILPSMFSEVYENVSKGTARWNELVAPSGQLYDWDPESTYIKCPPFFDGMTKELPVKSDRTVRGAKALLNLGDSITTDHISPAGSIAKRSPAARWLESRGVKPEDFNSYGSRRGSDEVMARGTFANTRLVNKFIGSAAPKTVFVEENGEKVVMDVYDAAMRYKELGTPCVLLAGKQVGSGSSRDWAAKGCLCHGIQVVIAESYERIFKSNLLGMGILPLMYKAGESAETIGLDGYETFDILVPSELVVGAEVKVVAKGADGVEKTFVCDLRLDTSLEIMYYVNGGILQFVLRNLLK